MRLCTKRNIPTNSKLHFPDSFNSVSTHVATPIKQSAAQNTRNRIHAIEENIRITKRSYNTFIRVNTGDTLAYLKLSRTPYRQ